jgi:hypothetical protein
MCFRNRGRAAAIAAKSQELDNARIEAARQAVQASMDSDFSSDPLFDPELSRLLSTASSVVKKHGRMIERVLGDTLERAHMVVKRNKQTPVTSSALKIVDAGKPHESTEERQEFRKSEVVDYIEIDILAIDEANGWAGAFSVKRGGGLTESTKRKANERYLRALNLTLASQLRNEGYLGVKTAEVAVIDYLGKSGFSNELTLRRDHIDRFFNLPIVDEIDRMTETLSTAFEAEFRRLLEPILNTVRQETRSQPGLTAKVGFGLLRQSQEDDEVIVEDNFITRH